MIRALAALALSAAVLAPASAAPEHAAPVPCADPCTIAAIVAAYVSPATAISSGTTVHWVTSTESHPTSDSYSFVDRCFRVSVGEGVAPTPVRFDIAAGTLHATTAPGTPGAATKSCGNAVGVEGGGFALRFVCLIHPYMHGALAVVP